MAGEIRSKEEETAGGITTLRLTRGLDAPRDEKRNVIPLSLILLTGSEWWCKSPTLFKVE